MAVHGSGPRGLALEQRFIARVTRLAHERVDLVPRGRHMLQDLTPEHATEWT